MKQFLLKKTLFFFSLIRLNRPYICSKTAFFHLLPVISSVKTSSNESNTLAQSSGLTPDLSATAAITSLLFISFCFYDYATKVACNRKCFLICRRKCFSSIRNPSYRRPDRFILSYILLLTIVILGTY